MFNRFPRISEIHRIIWKSSQNGPLLQRHEKVFTAKKPMNVFNKLGVAILAKCVSHQPTWSHFLPSMQCMGIWSLGRPTGSCTSAYLTCNLQFAEEVLISWHRHLNTEYWVGSGGGEVSGICFSTGAQKKKRRKETQNTVQNGNFRVKARGAILKRESISGFLQLISREYRVLRGISSCIFTHYSLDDKDRLGKHSKVCCCCCCVFLCLTGKRGVV